ncbi:MULTISPECIES: DUF6088 family protein [unclassified Bacteroides]|uniref:DUF6088 family protein n=1 Tax=unclassified Bacteroides TaxID=2646097 RepID=UPI0013D79173|nr:MULTISPECIES: DUF6088 family protein [unclassified Bacteroides]NDV64831.1 hypothetical protein [Bacteroides sp. 224]NDV80751.1 hypothetical protein [Bacteroides sp. 51]
MDNVASKIEKRIESLGKGSIFFPDDFIDLGSSDAIRQTLVRLCKEEKIVRIAQGIYCYPKVDEELGLGILMPSLDDVANALAKRDKARIVPTGIYALNVLGLSTQVPMNYVYLTDGSARHLEMYNGRKITFKRTTPKNLAFTSKLAMLITFALKALGKENLEEENIKKIHELLKHEPKESLIKDLPLMPVWIRNLITSTYE